MKRSITASLALGAAALGVAHPAAADQLGIEDVARLAVTTGPRLRAAREHAQAAEEQSKSARGRLLPSVHLSEEYQHWDRPFPAPFSLPGVTRELVLRDQDTNSFVVAGRQPLLGLFQGAHAYSSASERAEAAAAGVKTGESATREAVELEYLRLFQAKARVDIAHASEVELAQEVAETEARVKAGTQTNADLLRVRVAEANARQQGIVAAADVTVARANLLAAIGRDPSDETTEFVSPTALLARADVPVPRAGDAVARRPEMVEAERRAAAAEQEAKAKFYALLPEVDLEAAYLRTDGQAFAQKDSAYVGIKADWAIWEWGASYSAKQAAAAEARAAAFDVDATRRNVLAEIAARRAELTAAASAVQLAEQTIASAEEAYRVTGAQVRAGTGTTTDLLNAESALTEARLQRENARYAHAAARIRLERATGVR